MIKLITEDIENKVWVFESEDGYVFYDGENTYKTITIDTPCWDHYYNYEEVDENGNIVVLEDTEEEIYE